MQTRALQHPESALALQGDPWPRTLVTGATSGIGRELALQLARAGVPVLALGRDVARLQTLAASSPLIEPVACDLTDLASLPASAAQWAARCPDLACVIHNAGVQDKLRIDDAGYGPTQVRAEVEVNLMAPMVLTQALLPHLQSRRRAWVVHVTSGLAYAPKRTAAVYSATKAGLHLFNDALRVQMQGSGVRVVEVVMPLVDTAMTRGRGRGKLPPEEAARQLITGLRRGRDVVRVGKARALPWLHRWAPGLLASLMQRD